MTPYSTSRGILYTAPPTDENRAEDSPENRAEDRTENRAESSASAVPADD